MEKIIFIFLSLVILIIPPSFAQSPIGNLATQERTEVIISEEGNVHVIHEIKKDPRAARSFTMIQGSDSNLSVMDINGNEIQYGFVEEQKILTIFPSDENVLVEYDLADVFIQDNGVWRWDFLYTDSDPTKFVFPENIEIIFANESPVYINEVKNINCHGCQMKLEFVPNQEKILKEIVWEDKKFNVVIRTLSSIDSFNFDQPSRSINLDTNGKNQLVTMIIPLELLWNPYQVIEDNEKLFKHEFQINQTHVGLNFRPDVGEDIQIIGTSVVPEFPIIAPLLIGVMMVIALQFRNKIILR